jgi:hypothetical protein
MHSPWIRTLPRAYGSRNSRRGWHATTAAAAAPWARLVQFVGSALASDDRINPKKILERRYLYFALTALGYRELRQTHPQADAADLKVQAVSALHDSGVDERSNRELRVALQKSLAPQVLETFAAFADVDEALGLTTAAAASTDASAEDFFDALDWPLLLEVLQEEDIVTTRQLDPRTTQHGTSNNSNNNVGPSAASRAFWEIKRGALQTLLHFHGRVDEAPTPPSDGVDYFGMEEEEEEATGSRSSLASDARTRTIRRYQTINLCRSALLRESLGYSVLCLRSTIPGAGRGTFVDGDGATTGSLVAFQPGDTWPKEHLLTNAPDVMAHFADGDEDCQTSLRFDDYVLDARASPVTILTRQGSLNPWALGHMVNHPATGDYPNCQSLMLDFTEQMMRRQQGPLVRYIPNVYARPPGWSSRYFDPEPVAMHSLCLLARRDIAHEELCYDYRLQSHETPAWYEPITYGDDFLDKDPVVFFRDDWRTEKKEGSP